MKAFRNAVAGVVLGVGLTVAWYAGNGLVRDVQFAHAQERVDATRAQIANVQDMAAVFKAVGHAVEPSVVNIDVTKTVHTSDFFNRLRNQMPRGNNNGNGDNNGDMPEDFPQLPFDVPQGDMKQTGTGSGVIIETDGNTAYIVTNNHVASDASEMDVTLSDGRVIKKAKLVGTDPKSDLAVIKVEADHLIPAKWGDSATLEKGDIILAFGSPFGYVGSMTHGIVSALNRNEIGIIRNQFAYENFIQVDAPINPGNSGGPLVNLKGEVIGINTAIASENGGFQGIGFAIPSNQAKVVYEQIKTKGKVVRGWLGVGIEDVARAEDEAKSLGYEGHTGVLVKELHKGTPAFDKLEVNDVITAFNGKPMNTRAQLRSEVAATEPGKEIKLSVFRDKKQQEVAIKLGEQPEDMESFASSQQNGVRPGRTNPSAQVTADSLGVRVSAPSDNLLQRFGLDSGTKGAIITGISRNSLAAQARLQVGDVITQIDSSPVNSPDDVSDILSKKDLKSGVTLYVTSRESKRSVFIKSGEEK